jgi:hypothetical protein
MVSGTYSDALALAAATGDDDVTAFKALPVYALSSARQA